MSESQYLLADWRTPEVKAVRDGFGDGLLRVGERGDLVVLTADLSGSTRVDKFAKRYPDRYLDVGVAEQNLVGVAAGMASEGYVAVASSYGVFSPGRSWDQIRISVCYSNANVKIIGSHGGLSVGVNGATHQALEDLAMVRSLPNMKVVVPADANQAENAIDEIVGDYGPCYMRLTRPKSAVFTRHRKFEIGKAYVYKEGKDVSVFACGIQVWDAMMVAERLEKVGIDAEIINVSSLKPVDVGTIVASVEKTGKAVTIEDHQINGGLGSVVAEVLGEQFPTLMMRIGVEDSFGESGSWEELYKKYGLDQSSMTERISQFVR